MNIREQARVLVMASTFPRFAGDTTPPFVLRLCQALQAKGWQSLVLAPHAEGLAVHDRIEGIECHRFRYAPASLEKLAYGGGMLANVRAARWLWFLLPIYLLSLLLSAAGLLVRHKVAVVHAHWIIPQGLVAVVLGRVFFWRRLHIVVTAHGGDLHADMGRLARWLLRWTMRRADVLAVVSQDLRQLAIKAGVSPEKVVVASMGVDTEQFRCPATDSPREGVVFVGRLVDKKGVVYLLEAFALLQQEMPGLRLRIVGDGPLRGELEARVQALGLASGVEFLGAKPPRQIPGFFQSAELFVMPSVVADSGDQEGLGLVAAEAMSCGCPVVAFDIPAVRDLVRPGETGMMVPPKDVRQLAHVMGQLLADKTTAGRLASAARGHVVKYYSWTSVAERYSELYTTGLAASVEKTSRPG